MRQVLLIAVLLPLTLVAQRGDPLDERRRLAAAAVLPTSEDLLKMRSDRITRALRNPESLYQFVIRPQPSYLERRAAALQSKGLIPVEWVPRLWVAIGELRREQAVHSWGVKSHPGHAVRFDFSRPFPDTTTLSPRTILGALWTPPKEPIDYPLTPAERERAPWPWQVQEALMDLFGGLVPSTYGPAEPQKAQAYIGAVLTMPCATHEEAQLFVQAARYSSHIKTPAIMGALLNIALSPRDLRASIHVAIMYGDATRSWDDPRAWGIAAVGTLSMIRDSRQPGVRHNATYWIRLLREGFGQTVVTRPLPAAVVIEASRRAMDPASGDAWTRLYVYAFSVIDALDEKPFATERNLDPQSPRVAQLLANYGRWFESHRAALEQLAHDQQPELDAARQLLATEKCRG